MATKTVSGTTVTLTKPANKQLVKAVITKPMIISGSGESSWDNQRYVTGSAEIKITNDNGNITWGTVTFDSSNMFYVGTLDLNAGTRTDTHRVMEFDAVGWNNLITDDKPSIGLSAAGIVYYNQYLNQTADWSNPVSGQYPPVNNSHSSVGNSGDWSNGKPAFRVRAFTGSGYTLQMQIVSYYPQWTTNPGLDVIEAYIKSKKPQLVTPLATPLTSSFTPVKITPPVNTPVMTIAVPTGWSIEVEYEVQDTWAITLPDNWNASANPAKEGSTVTLTYTGEIAPNTPTVVGTYTTTGVSVTQVSEKVFRFTMPSEPVSVNATLKDYAIIEVEQTAGGEVTVSKTIAYDGDEIIAAAVPNEGYKLYSMRVSRNGQEITTTPIDETSVKFTVQI